MSLFLINVLCSTLTNPVSFEKCLIAIKEKAFSSSEYPVCVTLEDHLTSDLQAKAAEMLTRILGESLFYPKTSDPLTEFPSPESLKKRIIVSKKPPKEYLEASAAAKTALKDKGEGAQERRCGAENIKSSS
ncbi:hypothetical protein M758_12G068400 [Ceratodon purpureus]|nr:hypothetical protein M758_12G068400 [Ceratodon purpureus]